MSYKFIEHTADVQFEATGKTIEEVFKNSANALISLMKNNKKIKNKKTKKIKIKAKSLEELLYNFLEEFLYIYDSQNFITNKITNIKISKNKIKAMLIGDNIFNYKNISNNIKAITYNNMKIFQKKEKWFIRCVLDV